MATTTTTSAEPPVAPEAAAPPETGAAEQMEQMERTTLPETAAPERARLTPTIEAPSAEPVDDVSLSRWRFTVEQFQRMDDAGIFPDEARVELIDGEVVELAAIGPNHAGKVDRLNRAFSRRVGDDIVVRVQGPIELDEHSQPQPDLALLRGRIEGFELGHPTPREILLLVEVSDSTLTFDRRVKLPRYAAAGVPETWVLNLAGGSLPQTGSGRPVETFRHEPILEVYRQPTPDGYGDVQVLRRGDTITPEALPEVVIAVAELLGPPITGTEGEGLAH